MCGKTIKKKICSSHKLPTCKMTLLATVTMLCSTALVSTSGLTDVLNPLNSFSVPTNSIYLLLPCHSPNLISQSSVSTLTMPYQFSGTQTLGIDLIMSSPCSEFKNDRIKYPTLVLTPPLSLFAHWLLHLAFLLPAAQEGHCI